MPVLRLVVPVHYPNGIVTVDRAALDIGELKMLFNTNLLRSNQINCNDRNRKPCPSTFSQKSLQLVVRLVFFNFLLKGGLLKTDDLGKT